MKFRTNIKVFAPATVANVACGFDVLGFALEEPGDEIIVRSSNTPGIQISKIYGAKGKLSSDITKNTAGVAALGVYNHLKKHHDIDPQLGIALELYKKMPIGSGIGSSAASAVAGAMAVNEAFGSPLTKRELLPFAVAGEQLADGVYHADNVAPSLLGGFILIRDNESLDVHRIPHPRGLYAVVLSPNIQILTKDARGVLKDTVKLSDTIKQTGNLASLVLGLYTSNLGLISRSLKDHLIEPQRAQLIPHFHKVQEAALTNGALGCSISGAGPAIFALCENSLDAENVADNMKKIFADQKIRSSVITSPINSEGAVRC